MNGAVTVVVVTNGAVKQMVTENAIKRLSLCFTRCRGIGADAHAGRSSSATRSDEFAVNFDDASIARLDWTKLRVVTHLRQNDAVAIYDIDEAFISLCFLVKTINCNSWHLWCHSRLNVPRFGLRFHASATKCEILGGDAPR